MFHTRLKGTAAATAILLVAACSDSPNQPADTADDAQLDLDVAAYAAEATIADIGLMTFEADGIMQSPSAVGPMTGHLGNLTVSREVTFFGETGDSMLGYDPLLTASIHVLFSMEGTITHTGDRGTVTTLVSRERDITISGLLGEETQRTFDGTGSASKNRSIISDEHGERTLDFSSTTVIDLVVIPVPRGSGWPLSGTITRNVTVEVISGLGDLRTHERTVVIEFNGTNLVPITINGRTLTLDLETREIIDNSA